MTLVEAIATLPYFVQVRWYQESSPSERRAWCAANCQPTDYFISGAENWYRFKHKEHAALFTLMFG